MFIELRVPAVPRSIVQPDHAAGRQSAQAIAAAIAAAVAAAKRGSAARRGATVTSTRDWVAGPLSVTTRSIW